MNKIDYSRDFWFSKQTGILYAVLISLLSACGDSGSSSDAIDITENPHLNTVTVTRTQFETSGMKLGSLEKKSFAHKIKANGYIDVPPERKASVSVKLGGFVKGFTILPGEKVAQGAVLFTLENPDFIQLQQDYLEAKAQLGYLKSDYERQKSLADDNIASQKNYLKAESDFKVMQAKFSGLKERLKLLNINTTQLEEGVIESTIKVYAPIGGFISKVNITRGAFVGPADVAVEIVNTEHMHVELQVFERDIVDIRKGQPITFYLRGSATNPYKGEVYLVGQTIENDTRTINIHGHIEDEDQLTNVLPGMYVEATIDVATSLRTVLPSEAVVSQDDQYFVLVKVVDDEAGFSFKKQQVTIGEFDNEWTEIINAADFKTDDVFLVKGAFNLIVE
ncbi:MAG TPA: efflux RND transporter periplasmic adaptor subunit [Cyclobacteriaceae bacterium]|nr:efflux RND transporter periplasmic adaptor subunit [Cyclobacteriaceae bacterium]HRJ81140.1 efflux RND transporter periplasmic adaptor subunit [Cyclobacteriaceae bacterium]